MFGGAVRLRVGYTQRLVRQFERTLSDRDMMDWVNRLSLRMARPTAPYR